MRSFGRLTGSLAAGGLALLFALQLASADVGRSPKTDGAPDEVKRPAAIVALKIPPRPLMAFCRRPPPPEAERLGALELPATIPCVVADPGSDSDLTRPLYLQLFLAAHPQRRRAPPA